MEPLGIFKEISFIAFTLRGLENIDFLISKYFRRFSIVTIASMSSPPSRRQNKDDMRRNALAIFHLKQEVPCDIYQNKNHT
jgi:hypothetical protein